MISTSNADSSSTVVPSPVIQKVSVNGDSKGRLRVSREQRRLILAEFESSGVPAVQFAKRIGLKYSTLAGWLQRHGQTRRRKRARPVRLLEAVIEDVKGVCPLTLQLPGGARMELVRVEQVELAAALLRSLSC